ncbi:MAG: hypothetical protein CL862_06565 [Cyanobium sp. NAT70]|nr:hypothetical protein [Cyanobium sp. NAT70]
MSEILQQAYNALMAKAPGAAFPRARTLYLNKYPLPHSTDDTSLRLYVCEEQLDESQQPAPDGEEGHRIVTLTARPVRLALVHWQSMAQPVNDQVLNYLQRCWELDAKQLKLEHSSEPWFRNGGYQMRFTPPKQLIWQQQSLLTLPE